MRAATTAAFAVVAMAELTAAATATTQVVDTTVCVAGAVRRYCARMLLRVVWTFLMSTGSCSLTLHRTRRHLCIGLAVLLVWASRGVHYSFCVNMKTRTCTFPRYAKCRCKRYRHNPGSRHSVRASQRCTRPTSPAHLLVWAFGYVGPSHQPRLNGQCVHLMFA